GRARVRRGGGAVRSAQSGGATRVAAGAGRAHRTGAGTDLVPRSVVRTACKSAVPREDRARAGRYRHATGTLLVGYGGGDFRLSGYTGESAREQGAARPASFDPGYPGRHGSGRRRNRSEERRV